MDTNQVREQFQRLAVNDRIAVTADSLTGKLTVYVLTDFSYNGVTTAAHLVDTHPLHQLVLALIEEEDLEVDEGNGSIISVDGETIQADHLLAR